jgi:hypothetical protein
MLILLLRAVSLAVAVFLFAPSARADRPPRSAAVCVPGAEGPTVGVVQQLTGNAWAFSEHCDEVARRPLACGVLIHEGDHVVTDADGAVAFDVGSSRVHVGPDAEVIVATDANGMPDLALRKGRARIVDPDGAVADRRLATPDLVSVGHGDTEAGAVAGEPSYVCAYDGVLSVGAKTPRAVAPGACAGPDASLRDAATLSVSLLAAGRCDLALLDDDFDPVDVAAGPPGFLFPRPVVLAPPPPFCQAGTCSSTNPGPNPVGIVESPGMSEPPPL